MNRGEPWIVEVDTDDAGHARVLAPAVGVWNYRPAPGALLGAGSPIGRLTILNERHELRLPAGIAGRVEGDALQPAEVAVEFGQTLFRLQPVEAGQDVAAGEAAAAQADDVEPGLLALRAPSHGVFYLRPSPQEPPFVAVGQRVSLGATIGLIEVMKTFNPIQFEGVGWPDEAEIVELRAGEGQEVLSGDILIVAKP